ncbi:MAG TPA: hypothetical protein DIU15_18015 [Deltaproteobacteria bacterium]|nr:hypothetical protein [Deltaproteobacteria bacterium]
MSIDRLFCLLVATRGSDHSRAPYLGLSQLLLLVALALPGCRDEAGSSGFSWLDSDEDSTPEDAEEDEEEELPPIAEETLLVSFDDEMHALLVVDPKTGEGDLAFELPDDVSSICSTVFTRDGLLYGSGGGSLYEVDPCTGETVEVGSYPDGATICGMAALELEGLYGLNRGDDTLVQIDLDTAALTTVGPLGWEVGAHALTWDRQNSRFLAIDGSENRMMAVDPKTGESTALTSIDLDIAGVGAEKDPVTGEFYLCTGPNLYSIVVKTGEAQSIGRIGDSDSCNDLGATWIEVPCLGR